MEREDFARTMPPSTRKAIYTELNAVKEEIAELGNEIQAGDTEGIESEFGDILFSIINAARLYEVDPETALEKTNKKFIRRFNWLEKEARMRGKSLKEMTLDEMNSIWENAKNYD